MNTVTMRAGNRFIRMMLTEGLPYVNDAGYAVALVQVVLMKDELKPVTVPKSRWSS